MLRKLEFLSFNCERVHHYEATLQRPHTFIFDTFQTHNQHINILTKSIDFFKARSEKNLVNK